MKVEIWIGGIVVLIEEPRDHEELTHYIPYTKTDKFKAALHKGRFVIKSIQGPQVNGVWAITFDAGQNDCEYLIKFCQKIFTQFAEKIERGNDE